jgi:hypothetical protein
MKRAWLLTIALVVVAVIVLAIPALRHGCFRGMNSLFGGKPRFDPTTDIHGPVGAGGLSSGPIGGDDYFGKGRMTPGIDFCSYSAAKAVFLWADFGVGGSFHAEDDINGLKFNGCIKNTSGGKQIQMAGETKDGKTGKVTVAGQEYDLAKGGLFLVSARRAYKVLQLNRDLSRFADSKQLFNELSKNDPDILDFFTRALATSTDGKWTAHGKGNTLNLRENETGKTSSKNEGHTDDITALNFSPDGQLIATGGKDKQVILWTIPGCEIKRTLPVPSPVIHIEFSEDGKTLTVREATSEYTTTIRLFDVASGEQKGGVSTSTITPASEKAERKE